MSDTQTCKDLCLAAFDRGSRGIPTSPEARGWLEDFCSRWLTLRNIPAIWDATRRGRANGETFQERFSLIGQLSAEAADGSAIGRQQLQMATEEVVRASWCPFCPDPEEIYATTHAAAA